MNQNGTFGIDVYQDFSEGTDSNNTHISKGESRDWKRQKKDRILF